jgi:TonB family protein
MSAWRAGPEAGSCGPDPAPSHIQGHSVTALLLILALIGGGLAQSEPDTVPDEPPPLLQSPEVAEFVQADYPPEAGESGLEATVRLLIEIDTEGAVTRVEVLDGAGHGFDEAAIAAAQQMKFTPAIDETGPVPVAIEFDYGFVLNATEDSRVLSTEAEPTAEAPVNLEGTLREMGTRRPLERVVIRAVAGGFDFEAETTTDADGRYRFAGVPNGLVAVSAAQPGYKPVNRTVEVMEAQVTDLTLWMKNLSYRDDEIVIVYRKKTEDVTRRTISVREIRRVPGTFGDPVRVIQNLPGAARAPFGSGWMVIRGANPEDTAFYVDGIRVPIIYHLGGYVSILNDDLVGSVDYRPGGYSVEYGRSGGGVIDIKTSTYYPERFRFEWSTDLLDSGGLVQGRVGKRKRWGLTAAARRSYIDAVIPLLTKDLGLTVRPFWWDYQLKADDLEKADGRATVMLFGFGDKLFFGTPDSVAQGSDRDTQGDADVFYSAHRLIGQFEHRLSSDLTVRTTPSFGYDEFGFSLGNEWLFTQKSWLVEIRSDLLWKPNAAITVRPGLDLLAGPYDVRLQLPADPITLNDNNSLDEREDFEVVFKGSFVSPDPFLELQLRPLPKPDMLLVIPGVRLNTMFLSGDYQIWSLDPRLAARFSPIPGGTLKAGSGYYHQPPLGPDLGFEPKDITVDFERTWATEVGWEQAFGEAITADATFFYKRMTNLIVENEGADSLDDPFFVNGGLGRVRGMEIMLRHHPVDRFFGWVSYTLSKAERLDAPIDTGFHDRPTDTDDWRPFEYDQPHILVAVAGYDLPRDWGVSARFRYVSGNPYTPYAAGVYDIDNDAYFPYQTAEANADRLPPFTSLDLRIDKLFTFKHWQLETYIDFINVVRGKNAEYLRYNYDYTDSAYIRGLPFIPSPGIRAEFEL